MFISWFQGGEVFRSGVTYRRDKGKVFYFRPGHEAFPIYHMPIIQKVLINAVNWAAPGNIVNCQPGNPDPIVPFTIEDDGFDFKPVTHDH